MPIGHYVFFPWLATCLYSSECCISPQSSPSSNASSPSYDLRDHGPSPYPRTETNDPRGNGHRCPPLPPVTFPHGPRWPPDSSPLRRLCRCAHPKLISGGRKSKCDRPTMIRSGAALGDTPATDPDISDGEGCSCSTRATVGDGTASLPLLTATWRFSSCLSPPPLGAMAKLKANSRMSTRTSTGRTCLQPPSAARARNIRCALLRAEKVLALFALRRPLRFPVSRCCYSSDFSSHAITPVSTIPVLITLDHPCINYSL
jgi:hypothetical protein